MSRDVPDLVTDNEFDEIFRLPRGRSKRLARLGELPAVVVGGEVRFRRELVDRLLNAGLPDHRPTQPQLRLVGEEVRGGH